MKLEAEASIDCPAQCGKMATFNFQVPTTGQPTFSHFTCPDCSSIYVLKVLIPKNALRNECRIFVEHPVWVNPKILEMRRLAKFDLRTATKQ